MLRALAATFLCIGFIAFMGCSSSGSSSIEGPILDLNELESIVVDQLFINGGMEDEYRSHGEFSVYLRDAATNKDIACTAPADGMAELSAPGVYYGELSIPFREVSSEHPSSVARFKIVFVEKDGPECPGPLDAEDDIAGESAELTSDELVNQVIWSTNGKAAVVLRGISGAPLSIRSMAPALTDGLSIDKLFFEHEAENDTPPRYYLFAERVDNGTATYQCQVDDAFMDSIRAGRVLYAALGFPIPCLDPNEPGFENIKVRVGLYVQTSAGPELVAATDAKAIADLVGEKILFSEGTGSISFQRVSTTPFASNVIRLSELTSLAVAAMDLAATPSTASALELHALAVDSGLSIACAGEAQGLSVIQAAGSYDNLAAAFVATDGQKELFGWEKVRLELVERSDGATCPTPPGNEATVLLQTRELSPADLAAGHVSFESQSGGMTFVQQVTP